MSTIADFVGNRLIAALDVTSRAEADALVGRLGGVPSWLKIGLELFLAEGATIVRDYSVGGASIMLDLKLHDIPETVGRATARVAPLGAKLLTIHAEGRAMIEAAVNAAEPHGMKILAVTVLTSLDDSDLAASGVVGSIVDTVEKRARLAIAAGAHGVVASPHEVARIRAFAPKEFLIVTPGIRPAAANDDQKRVMTPAQARAAGSDLIVVGRPLRDAPDPATAARAIVQELS